MHYNIYNWFGVQICNFSAGSLSDLGDTVHAADVQQLVRVPVVRPGLRALPGHVLDHLRPALLPIRPHQGAGTQAQRSKYTFFCLSVHCYVFVESY